MATSAVRDAAWITRAYGNLVVIERPPCSLWLSPPVTTGEAPRRLRSRLVLMVPVPASAGPHAGCVSSRLKKLALDVGASGVEVLVHGAAPWWLMGRGFGQIR